MKNDHFLRDPVLVLIAKRPRVGYGKQRLAAELGRAAAFAVAEQLLACALEDLGSWPGSVVIAPSRQEDLDWAATLLERPLSVIGQGEGNLGQRLQRIDQQLRQRGAERIVYMGSDSPALLPHQYQAAVQALAETDVVLSAADDGGVVLMGASKPWPALAELPWSTAALGEALAEACRRVGLAYRYMAPGYDVDVAADLNRLLEDLASDPRPARRQLRRLLQSLSLSPSPAQQRPARER